jgi:hypothetical protein
MIGSRMDETCSHSVEQLSAPVLPASPDLGAIPETLFALARESETLWALSQKKCRAHPALQRKEDTIHNLRLLQPETTGRALQALISSPTRICSESRHAQPGFTNRMSWMVRPETSGTKHACGQFVVPVLQTRSFTTSSRCSLYLRAS